MSRLLLLLACAALTEALLHKHNDAEAEGAAVTEALLHKHNDAEAEGVIESAALKRSWYRTLPLTTYGRRPYRRPMAVSFHQVSAERVHGKGTEEETQRILSKMGFLILGAMKSGTTSYYSAFTSHKAMGRVAFKEVHYFDDGCAFNATSECSGPGYVDAMGMGGMPQPALAQRMEIADPWKVIIMKAQRKEAERRAVAISATGSLSLAHEVVARVIGEASPTYLTFPSIVPLVRQLIPKAVGIVLLRNPVDRTMSHMYHNLRHSRYASTHAAFDTVRSQLSHFTHGDCLSLKQAIQAGKLGLDEYPKCLEQAGVGAHPTNTIHARQAESTLILKSLYLPQLAAWESSGATLLVMPSESYYQWPEESLQQGWKAVLGADQHAGEQTEAMAVLKERAEHRKRTGALDSRHSVDMDQDAVKVRAEVAVALKPFSHSMLSVLHGWEAKEGSKVTLWGFDDAKCSALGSRCWWK